jgi:hypothetical protein
MDGVPKKTPRDTKTKSEVKETDGEMANESTRNEGHLPTGKIIRIYLVPCSALYWTQYSVGRPAGTYGQGPFWGGYILQYAMLYMMQTTHREIRTR